MKNIEHIATIKEKSEKEEADEEHEKGDEKEHEKEQKDHHEMVQIPPWAQSLICSSVVGIIVLIANTYSNMKIVRKNDNFIRFLAL